MEIKKLQQDHKSNPQPQLSLIANNREWPFPPNGDNDCGPASFMMLLRPSISHLTSHNMQFRRSFEYEHKEVNNILLSYSDKNSSRRGGKWKSIRESLYEQLNRNVPNIEALGTGNIAKDHRYNLGAPIAVFEYLPNNLLASYPTSPNDLLFSFQQEVECTYCHTTGSSGAATLGIQAKVDSMSGHVRAAALFTEDMCIVCKQPSHTVRITNAPMLMFVVAQPYVIATRVHPLTMESTRSISLVANSTRTHTYELCGVMYFTHDVFRSGSVVNNHDVHHFIADILMPNHTWACYDGLKRYYLSLPDGPQLFFNQRRKEEAVIFVYTKS